MPTYKFYYGASKHEHQEFEAEDDTAAREEVHEWMETTGIPVRSLTRVEGNEEVILDIQHL